MERKRGDILIGFLSLADITALISMSTSLSSGAWNYFVFAFDAMVVAFIIFSFCRRLKESPQKARYLLRNWYEIFGMIPIVFFALAGQISNDHNGFITLGIALRLLAIIYLLKLSRSIEDKSRIFGNQITLQIFIVFILILIVSSFFSIRLNVLT
jgi:hypothetical protein